MATLTYYEEIFSFFQILSKSIPIPPQPSSYPFFFFNRFSSPHPELETPTCVPESPPSLTGIVYPLRLTYSSPPFSGKQSLSSLFSQRFRQLPFVLALRDVGQRETPPPLHSSPLGWEPERALIMVLSRHLSRYSAFGALFKR